MSSDFRSTLWTEVLRAGDGHLSALQRLCETYWKPVYAYVRCKGYAAEDAEDRTQGFFVHLLEKELLARVESGRGRFRNYLITVVEYYLANEYRKDQARKRIVEIAGAEREITEGPEKPEEAYRRAWMLTVLEQAFAALRREFESKGLQGQFEAVRSHLSAAHDRPSYEDLAGRLGGSVSDVTNLLHRSRNRLREHLRAVLRETVSTEAEVDSEIRELFSGP